MFILIYTSNDNTKVKKIKMYLFIAIIFIAELIVALTLINGIIKADRAVCALNKRVLQAKPEIKNFLQQANECASCLKESVNSVITFVKRKHRQVMQRAIKTVLIYFILLTIKSRYKNLATFCQYAVLAKDYWDGLPA